MKKFIGFEKGVNLGGWLSQCEYTREHFNSFITEKDIETLASWGIDHVRIPVDYNVFETESGGYREEGFGYVKRAIEWCRKYELNMILDLHKTAGYSFDAYHGEDGFFDSEALQERFYRLWEEFAQRFGIYDDMIAFELLNEVTDKAVSDVWNKIIRTAIGRIRRFAPRVPVLVGGYWNNSVDALADLELPLDSRIVYNFHCYDPFLFTHQSAGWVDKMPADFSIAYPGDVKEYRRRIKEIGLDFMQNYDDVSDCGFSTDYFISRFKGAIKLCEERDVALYCGEYGVINKAEPADTFKWYRDINTAFEALGIGRAAWSYKQMDFGLCDPHMAEIIEKIKTYL